MRLVVVLIAFVLLAAPARADWNGDNAGDVLAIDPNGAMLMYRGNGSGGWATGRAEPIGSGWQTFNALLAPGDFSGDGKPDLLARAPDGTLYLYRGNGAGGWVLGRGEPVGSGWQSFTALLAPGDFSGDGKPDVLARTPDGALRLYRGNGASGWLDNGIQVGSGWQSFTAVIAGGDFSGDGKPDVLARTQDGALLMYRGNGAGGWLTGRGEPVGSGWQPFTALASGGDFSGDGKPDVLARNPDGGLRLYRGNGASGWFDNGIQIGSGWQSLTYLTLVGGSPPPPPPPPPAAAPAPLSTALPGARARLRGPKGCTQPGGRMRVTLRVRRVRGRAAAHVRRVLFFVRGGPRRMDRHRPYAVRLKLDMPAGKRGRVYARVYFTRAGSSRLRSKTVSRRFTICG